MENKVDYLIVVSAHGAMSRDTIKLALEVRENMQKQYPKSKIEIFKRTTTYEEIK